MEKEYKVSDPPGFRTKRPLNSFNLVSKVLGLSEQGPNEGVMAVVTTEGGVSLMRQFN